MAEAMERVFHLTGEALLAYPYLTETEKFKGKDTGNYSVTLILQDEKSYKALFDKIMTVGKKLHGDRQFKNPLRSTDDDNGGESTPLIDKGAPEGWSIKATTKYRVDLVDRDPKQPLQAIEFYPGMVVRAHLSLVPYDGLGRGVKAYLQGLQKVKDAPRLNLGGAGSGSPFYNLDDPKEDRMAAAEEGLSL